MNAVDHLSECPHPVFFAAVSGAHLYGFPSADSDVDVRGVMILPPRALLGLRPSRETWEVSEGDADLVLHDLGKAGQLLWRGNGNLLEHVAAPLQLGGCDPERFARLQALLPELRCKRIADHYCGFLHGELRELATWPNRRLKKALYAYRVALTGLHFVVANQIEPNLNRLWERYDAPPAAALIERKRAGGERDDLTDREVREQLAHLDRLRERLAASVAAADLPLEPPAGLLDRLEELLLTTRFAHHLELDRRSPRGACATFRSLAEVLQGA